jgi:hypothetical protein
MIAPTVHRQLQRSHVLELISAIGRADRRAAGEAAAALERGDVDTVLDTPAAVDAVRGHGGAPAPVSLALLWYVPVRAELLARHEANIGLADFTATVPLVFLRELQGSAHAASDRISEFLRAVEALPHGTTGRAETASRCGARALWWAGCFPDHLRDRYGAGARRAFLTLAATMLREAARIIAGRAPDLASLYVTVAGRVQLLSEALHAVAEDYIGPDAHTARGRIDRYLSRLEQGHAA